MLQQLQSIAPDNKFVNLVKLSLPSDIDPNELFALSPKKWWSSNPYLATVYALRKCHRINWKAYSLRNPDVIASGIDPCFHFIKHGIYEGRKIISWNVHKTIELAGIPLVSVVIINYNNSAYIGKCIDSVINQTLKEIEIIIVDDCSTDDSLAIIEKYKREDKRIHVTKNEINSFSLLSRRKGVDMARGRYVIFLDSDDYLSPDACKIAYSEISKGYDIVKFGMNIVNSCNHSQEEIVNCDLFCNKGDTGEYLYDDILTSIFDSRKIGWLLCGNIFLREICVAAFSELPNEKLTGPDDALAVMAIARHTRNMYKISDKLYYYNFGPGLTVTDDPRKVINYAPAMARATTLLYNYAIRYALNINAQNLYIESSDNLIRRLINICSMTDISHEFKQLTDILGLPAVLQILIHRYAPQHFEKIESLIRQWIPTRRKIKHIGIILPISVSSIINFIIPFIRELIICGYNVTCFSEKSMDELHILLGVDIVYIYPPWSGFPMLPERILGFRQLVLKYNIDIIFHGGIDLPCVFWDIMMLHYHNIPVVVMDNFKSAIPFSRSKTDIRNWEKYSLHCADLVTCNSLIDELFLRISGSNSFYLPPIVDQYDFAESQHNYKRVAFIVRDETELSEIIECFQIMKEVIDKNPYISLNIICKTSVNKYNDEIRKYIYAYGMASNVSIKNAISNQINILNGCDILISLSYNDICHIDLAKAQAIGLPCIVYDIPMNFINDNPGIIKVKYGDHFELARRIISILMNIKELNYLSMIGISAMKKYQPEKFRKELSYMLTNFQLFSPIRNYSKNDYDMIIRNACFYDEH